MAVLKSRKSNFTKNKWTHLFKIKHTKSINYNGTYKLKSLRPQKYNYKPSLTSSISGLKLQKTLVYNNNNYKCY